MASNNGSSHSQGSVSWTALQVVIGTFYLILGASLMLLTVALIMVKMENVDPAIVAVISSLLLGLIILMIVWYFALRSKNGSFMILGIRSPRTSGWQLACWTAGVFLVSVLFTGFYTVIIRQIGIEILLPPEDYSDILLDDMWFAVSFIALVLWTPFTEEVFFRGFIYEGFSQTFGDSKAILLSAGIFSLFHILAGPGVLIPIFVSGLALAFLYHRTGSLLPCIVVHSIQNSFAVIASFVNVDGPNLSAIIPLEIFSLVELVVT
mgnify:CR=1 FL=1